MEVKKNLEHEIEEKTLRSYGHVRKTDDVRMRKAV